MFIKGILQPVTNLVAQTVESVLGDPNASGLLHLPLVPNDSKGSAGSIDGMDSWVVESDSVGRIDLLAFFADNTTRTTTRQHSLALSHPNTPAANDKRPLLN